MAGGRAKNRFVGSAGGRARLFLGRQAFDEHLGADRPQMRVDQLAGGRNQKGGRQALQFETGNGFSRAQRSER